MTQQDKVQKLGQAVTQLERELIDEGNSHAAGKLVSAFATLPPASMARLYDILNPSPRPLGATENIGSVPNEA